MMPNYAKTISPQHNQCHWTPPRLLGLLGLVCYKDMINDDVICVSELEYAFIIKVIEFVLSTTIPNDAYCSDLHICLFLLM